MVVEKCPDGQIVDPQKKIQVYFYVLLVKQNAFVPVLLVVFVNLYAVKRFSGCKCKKVNGRKRYDCEFFPEVL